MAQQKKGLIYRLTMGKDNLPDFMPDKLPGSRWALFKDVFFNRIGAMAKISLLTLLFFIPLVIVIVLFSLMKTNVASVIPYSGNIGIGYPVILNAEAIGQWQEFSLNIQMLLFLIPAVIIAGIGLAGAFHVMKLLAWEEGESVANNFFIGIKKNIKQFLPMSVMAALLVFISLFSINTYQNAEQNSTFMTVFSVIGMVLTIILLVIFICMLIFMTTQAVTYELKFRYLIKNSFIFAVALLPQNLFFILVSLLPVILLLLLPIPIMFSMMLWLVYALIGIAFTILVWTVYAHWAYDRFVNDRVEGAIKNRGMHIKTPEEEKAAEIERLKTRNIVYGSAYVSKRLSSIDEGSGFTPLSENFSRADLLKMQNEKKQMQEELEKEVSTINSEIEAEIRAFEEAQNQSKKKKKPGAAKPAPAERLEELRESSSDIAYSDADFGDAEDVPAVKPEPAKRPEAAKKPSQPRIPEKDYHQHRSKAKIVTSTKKKGGKP